MYGPETISLETPKGPIVIVTHPEAMTPSPYTRIGCKYMPNLTGMVMGDIGTGSGALAIAMVKMGADRVFVSDINQHIIEAALYNAQVNGVADKIVGLKPGSLFRPYRGLKLDGFVSNPAQLPVTQEEEGTPYSSGRDGRRMIDGIITGASQYLKERGGLLLVTTSLIDFNKTRQMLKLNGYAHEIIARQYLPLRDFYDREMIVGEMGVRQGMATSTEGCPIYDKQFGYVELGKYEFEDNLGIYETENNVPYERIYFIQTAHMPKYEVTHRGPFEYTRIVRYPDFLCPKGYDTDEFEAARNQIGMIP